MKKHSLVLLLMLTACQNENESADQSNFFDKIKTFLGISKPEIPIEDARPEGQTRILPPIKSDVSEGDWTGGTMDYSDPAHVNDSDQANGNDGPGSVLPEVDSNPRLSDSESPQNSFDSVPSQQDESQTTPQDAPPISMDQDPIQSPDVLPSDAPALVYGPDMPTDEGVSMSSDHPEKNPEDITPQDRPWSPSGLDYGYPEGQVVVPENSNSSAN